MFWSEFSPWSRLAAVPDEPNPLLRPVPGEFYYGHDCVHCGAFIPHVWDDAKGEGRPAQITSKDNQVEKLKCPSCQHEAAYFVGLMHRRQV